MTKLEDSGQSGGSSLDFDLVVRGGRGVGWPQGTAKDYGLSPVKVAGTDPATIRADLRAGILAAWREAVAHLIAEIDPARLGPRQGRESHCARCRRWVGDQVMPTCVCKGIICLKCGTCGCRIPSWRQGAT